MKKKSYRKSELDKPVTLGVLLEYTDDFLIPKISDIMDEKFKSRDEKINNLENGLKNLDNKVSKFEYNLKVYIDEKLSDYTSDIFKRLEKKQQKDSQFKEKVVELFKKHHIGSPEELAFLHGLVMGS